MASGRRPRSPWQEAIAAGSVGLEMAIAISIGYFGGRWADGALDTRPWLQWIGLICGIAAAALAIVRVSRRYLRDVDRDDDGRGESDGDRRV